MLGASAGREKVVSGEAAASELELRGVEVRGDGSITGRSGRRAAARAEKRTQREAPLERSPGRTS
jgi:hypothetical protein